VTNAIYKTSKLLAGSEWAQIAADAINAAIEGLPRDFCPWSYDNPQGEAWIAAYEIALKFRPAE
jgi:hypothetical protein